MSDIAVLEARLQELHARTAETPLFSKGDQLFLWRVLIKLLRDAVESLCNFGGYRGVIVVHRTDDLVADTQPDEQFGSIWVSGHHALRRLVEGQGATTVLDRKGIGCGSTGRGGGGLRRCAGLYCGGGRRSRYSSRDRSGACSEHGCRKDKRYKLTQLLHRVVLPLRLSRLTKQTDDASVLAGRLSGARSNCADIGIRPSQLV